MASAAACLACLHLIGQLLRAQAQASDGPLRKKKKAKAIVPWVLEMLLPDADPSPMTSW